MDTILYLQKPAKTRRITKKQEKNLLSSSKINDVQKNFLYSLLAFQRKYPQLTSKQWESFLKLYKDING